MKKRYVIIIALGIALSGCAEIKPMQNHYYLLTPAINQHTEMASTPANIRIELAQFLAQGTLVVQIDEQRVQPSHYQQWAEPLPEMIERYLQRHLQQYDQTGIEAPITVVIDRFHGSVAGDVRFSGQWWQGDQRPQRFDYQAEQQQAGYAEMVVTLQQLLDKLSIEIGLKLNGENIN